MDMAASIIADAINGVGDVKQREAYDSIITTYGRDTEAVQKLAETLKDVAKKQKEQTVLELVTKNSKFTDTGESISKKIKDIDPFGYRP
jgi:flavorubredoxin